MISLIAAVARNGAIGRNQQLLWRLPEDMRYFRETTSGKTVIMGRKTWESLPPAYRPLPNRRNIVLSRNPAYLPRGGDLACSIEDALRLVGGAAEVFATAGSPVKREYLQRLGIRHVYDSRTPGFRDEIMEQTGNHGVDVVLDSRAGAGFRESYALLRAGGRLVVYGASSVSTGNTRDLFAAAKMWVTTPSYGALPLMQESKSVCGVNLLKLWDDQGHLERVAKPITRLMAEGGTASLDYGVVERPRATHHASSTSPVGSAKSMPSVNAGSVWKRLPRNSSSAVPLMRSAPGP